MTIEDICSSHFTGYIYKNKGSEFLWFMSIFDTTPKKWRKFYEKNNFNLYLL